MKTLEVKGEPRAKIGTKYSKALRRENKVPCVLYGSAENVHFSTTELDVRDVIYAHELRQVKIAVDGKSYDAILKDAQFHPVTDRISHLDFQELVPGKKIKTEIPVKFSGVAKGVKEGGMQKDKLRKLKVICAPEALLEYVEVDVSNLKLGQSFRVRDLNLQGIEIQNSPAIPIVSIEATRASRSGTEGGEEAADAGGTTEGGATEGGDASAAE